MTHLYTDDAELYDIAFDWDISDEADWIVERLEATTVLEPGCGSGRMLEALGGSGLSGGRDRHFAADDRAVAAAARDER